MTNPLISVIIPTFNRFDSLLHAVTSVVEQTYKNIEIIIVNDCSTDEKYYKFNFSEKFGQNLKIIHMKTNTKNIFGYPCAGMVRNIGIKNSQGDFIAFLDDDDYWFPEKLEKQLKEIKNIKCEMSCTEGVVGDGLYNKNINYKKYNSEHCIDKIVEFYKNKYNGGTKFLNLLQKKKFPRVWNLEFIAVHNCCICSSILIKKNILEKTNLFKHLPNGEEDWELWLRLLRYTNCIYIDEPCLFYNS